MAVNSNDFGISIIADDVTHLARNNGRYNYFSLPNFSEYAIKLINNREVRCDATVSVDGEKIGTWRIPSFDSITILRPANINRHLVFIEEKSKYAKYVGLTKNNPYNGVIRVVFKPELKSLCPYESLSGFVSAPTFYDKWAFGYDDSITRPPVEEYSLRLYKNSVGRNTQNIGINSNNCSYTKGATILGSGTDQNFNISSRIYNYDANNITTISIRLIVKKKNQPYISLKEGLKSSPDVVYENPYYEPIYPPVHNLTKRFYDDDDILIEKPYYN